MESKQWSFREDKFITDNCDKLSSSEISAELNVSTYLVNKRFKELGLWRDRIAFNAVNRCTNNCAQGRQNMRDINVRAWRVKSCSNRDTRAVSGYKSKVKALLRKFGYIVHDNPNVIIITPKVVKRNLGYEKRMMLDYNFKVKDMRDPANPKLVDLSKRWEEHHYYPD